jgi:cellulose synthase/poly-beta-1,6-N-acetylglucosamine synthase-like glycosyltransferase
VASALDKTGLIVLTAMVMAGAIPLAAALYQFSLIGLHGIRNHYGKVAEALRELGDVTPRTAIIVPAWNEAAVIGATVDRLVSMDYPEDCLHVYVVDDASTDATPVVLGAKELEYPGRVFHLRRDKGGQGKAHTLNYGLGLILADDWCEAVLIMDADVIFERETLRKMARHLGDPDVGAVTAYIKEGSHPANYLARFIGFEYITAQAASRRAQNVIGALACLAGGAQLHKRESLVAIGGRIDTSSLAEDTFTTFMTQREGRKVVFDGNAVVWAEEPADIVGLWKQRLRWARGNVQVSLRYKWVWFRPYRDRRLGGLSFGLFWFTIFLMPVFMICASVGLVTLYFVNSPYSWAVFRLLWITNAITYLFVTLFSFAIDPATARRTWFQGLMFPGVVSLVIIAYTCFPPLFNTYLREAFRAIGLPTRGAIVSAAILFAYVWLTASMVVAWAAKEFEGLGRLRVLSPLLVYTAGYGPLLCAITLTAYLKEARGAEMKWDKTVKTGKVLG